MVKINLEQMELFIATATDISPKEQQELMQRCWFNLARQKRTKPIEHHFGESWVKISGNKEFGIASIFDNDVVIFALSHYMNAINQNHKVGRRFFFTGYDYFKFIGRRTFGGKAYNDLWNSLQRLHHTFVETNLRLGSSKRHHSFNWLSEIKQVVENGKHRGYEVVIPEWLYSSVVDDKLVLTLDDGYFSLKGGLERWLYLFARKTAGKQVTGWKESVENIWRKSGSNSSLSEFKRQIARISNNRALLSYKMKDVEVGNKQGLYFRRLTK